MFVCIFVCILVHICTCTFGCVFVCIFVFIFVCVFTCIFVCINWTTDHGQRRPNKAVFSRGSVEALAVQLPKTLFYVNKCNIFIRLILVAFKSAELNGRAQW